MSYPNPTPLGLGATGALDGRNWRVAGRVVLGATLDDGETYYWNEFNLVDGFGRSATLVFEETETGPQWKLFKRFEPLRAMTAAEAAAQRVGGSVNLDGTPARITLVDQSRVHYLEGTAPDGVEVGDVADYFNVESGPRLLVASWTGDEIEFYEGSPLPGQRVAAAFGLLRSAPAFAPAALSRLDRPATGPGWSMKAVAAVLGGVVLFGFFSCGVCNRNTARSLPPPAKRPAPAARLTVGAHGPLAGVACTVASHALIEIDRFGARQERHEYSLRGDDGVFRLLVQGLNGAAGEWHLFSPIPPLPLGPYEAAALRKGAAVPLPDHLLRVTTLFQSKRRAADGAAAGALWPELSYGFVANDGDDWLLVRWTETDIRFARGRPVPDAEVTAALGRGAAGPGVRP